MMDVCAASREDLAFPIGSWLDAPVFTGDVYLKPMVQGEEMESQELKQIHTAGRLRKWLEVKGFRGARTLRRLFLYARKRECADNILLEKRQQQQAK